MEKFRIDHDLHIHSQLSECSSDPAQNTAAILAYGVKNGFHTVSIADHFWDETIPGAYPWYVPQNFKHISSVLPLPQDENCRFLFGCETEFDKHFTVACSPWLYDKFDFIVVPTTHLHMHGLTIDAKDFGSHLGRAYLWVKRFEELLGKDLPAGKTGIAHLTCSLMCGPGFVDGSKEHHDILNRIRDEEMGALFTKAAEKGYGIELNFPVDKFEGEDLEKELRPYRIAKECGCKFYLGSDAHHPKTFEWICGRFARGVEALGLTEEDKMDIVRR